MGLCDRLKETRVFPQGWYGVPLDSLPEPMRSWLIDKAVVKPTGTLGITVDIEWPLDDRLTFTFHTRKKRYARLLNVMPRFVDQAQIDELIEQIRTLVLS